MFQRKEDGFGKEQEMEARTYIKDESGCSSCELAEDLFQGRQQANLCEEVARWCGLESPNGGRHQNIMPPRRKFTALWWNFMKFTVWINSLNDNYEAKTYSCIVSDQVRKKSEKKNSHGKSFQAPSFSLNRNAAREKPCKRQLLVPNNFRRQNKTPSRQHCFQSVAAAAKKNREQSSDTGIVVARYRSVHRCCFSPFRVLYSRFRSRTVAVGLFSFSRLENSGGCQNSGKNTVKKKSAMTYYIATQESIVPSFHQGQISPSPGKGSSGNLQLLLKRSSRDLHGKGSSGIEAGDLHGKGSCCERSPECGDGAVINHTFSFLWSITRSSAWPPAPEREEMEIVTVGKVLILARASAGLHRQLLNNDRLVAP
ncbi:hypothetical protein KSP40_PGU008719 [Platanthera guangdongensis]|uniref:Uncharacterized protein n=1 Tax=Platanthera guangdongensis TaxID=2320717 RepID=A0ABR2MF43_9ASPA